VDACCVRRVESGLVQFARYIPMVAVVSVEISWIGQYALQQFFFDLLMTSFSWQMIRHNLHFFLLAALT
jgi:hypothetical protein